MGIIYNEIFLKNIEPAITDKYNSCGRIIIYIIISAGIIAGFAIGNYTASLYMYYDIVLMQISYVDYHTGYVYNKMINAALLPYIASVLIIVTCNGSISELILLAGVTAIMHMLCRKGYIGEGDVEVLAVNYGIIYVCFWRGLESYDIVFNMLLYWNIMLLLFIIRYRHEIKWRELRLKRPCPLVPSIYMTNNIFILSLLLARYKI